ncbi:hypothetical protein ACFQZ4_24025 [Catellatospora coxensis]|uniref:Uncharacterized protein n=1 Tax=Catellatospora coxensis TaxID=310354 RepID=A0A8J3PAD6_9ACTN|nr:hypothetical protein [Catellatospora coxensis]GIG10186.1 hypothetical protein Cco03nite_68860 [Catellatospora coxensis]
MTPQPRRPRPACTTLPRPRRRIDLDARYTLTLAGHIAALQVKP